MLAKENPILSSLDTIRDELRAKIHIDEDVCVADLLQTANTDSKLRKKIEQRAHDLVETCRAQRSKRSLLDAFLQEFGLSNREGIALMCLAEALLRIPDAGTADKLINEKILSGDWTGHFNQSDSVFVNAATIGLIMTGGIVSLGDDITANPVSWLKGLTSKLSEPVIRTAMMQAMGIMGKQYVLGRTIKEAVRCGKKGNPEGTRFSFDMLGEGARTMRDAQRYFEAYLAAIHSIGETIEGESADNVYDADGISVKLSALHPRYHYSHEATVMKELLPQLKKLALAAKQYNIGFTIDAEESERLDISLDIFEALARDVDLQDWDGLGLVVQAYQKRAPYVIDWLAALGRETERKLMVRLVKGAYWDREIKFAHEMGYDDFPVYTRKHTTDLCYQVCAERLLDADDVIYPQFATHNAHTVALVLELAFSNGKQKKFEFQRLHGMGELLYGEALDAKLATAEDIPLRVYAPVGAHKDLLPYLVRRLLENGANSSFVNRFLDPETPVFELIEDPITQVERSKPYRHPRIPKPLDIYIASGHDGGNRKNSAGLDLDNPQAVSRMYEIMKQAENKQWQAGPLVNGKLCTDEKANDVCSPTNRKHVVGKCYQTSDKHIEQALTAASKAYGDWDKLGGAKRADALNKVADLLEENREVLMALISEEAGRTVADTLSEVREAVDFCRYYALKAREHFAEPMPLPGPTGEQNELSLHGRGTFLCISPWNFPLAIFVGQVAAALAAGNCVIAKPAEQTPIIAYEAVKLFHEAGIPGDVLHLLTGKGSQLGPKLVPDQRITGVCFTGSTGVAKFINKQLCERDGAIVPLIAETGGQNAMIVDSSALPEQVVDDVIASAFMSAGQRCSALRVLFLQEDIAEDTIEMLKGALEALELGNPAELATDVGPVIDDGAHQGLQEHIDMMEKSKSANIIARYADDKTPKEGSFFAPTIIEIDSINLLKEEVFGPVLHIVRYKGKELDKVIEDINATGFGLTLGVHSRVEGVADHIFENTHVGNTYINRNMVGAVVGVQPFGGQGLSGTGPKAGGPHYLFRFATEKTKTVNVVATGGNVQLFNIDVDGSTA